MGQKIFKAGTVGGMVGGQSSNTAIGGNTSNNIVMKAGTAGGAVQNINLLVEDDIKDLFATQKAAVQTVIPQNDPFSKIKKAQEEREFLLTNAASASYNHEYATAKKQIETAQAEAKAKEDKLKSEYENLKKIYDGGMSIANGLTNIDRSDPQAYDDLTAQNTAYVKKYGYNSLGELEAAYKQKQAEYEKQKTLNYYSSLPSGNYDKSVKDDLYQFINYAPKNQEELIKNAVSTARNRRRYSEFKYMNDREKGIYNYIYATEGKKAANEFLDFIKESLGTKEHIATLENLEEFSNKNILTAGVAAVASVPLQLNASVEQVGNTVEYLFTGQLDRNINADYAAIARQGMSNKVNLEIAGWDVFDFAYNSVMSGVDTLVVSPLGPAGAVVLGLNAAASTTNDIISRGGSVEQAFWGGLAAGVFEGIFEKISLGQLSAFKDITETVWKDGLRNFVNTVVVNASEEGATEIANILWDTFVNKDISNYSAIYDKFYNEAIGSGASEEAARTQAVFKSVGSLALQVAEAAGSGALMGGGFAMIGKAMSHNNAVNVGKIIAENEAQGQIIELGLSMDDLSDSHKMAAKIQNSGNMSNVSLGKLAVQIINDVSEQKSSVVSNAVTQYAAKLQINEIEAQSVASYFGKAISQQSISNKEYNAVKNSSFANIVAKELQTDTEWVSNMKAELSAVESIESQVREAITLRDTSNPILQSSANENNSALQSGAEGDIISQGGEENGRTLNQRTVYGSVEENAGTGNKSEIRQSGATVDEYVAGGKAEILSRASSDGRRVVRVNYGNSNVTFTEGKVEDTPGYKVYTAFKNAGMKVIYCDGKIERTVNGKVISRTEAFTAPDGTVYVSSESKLPPKQTFDHEKVHVADKTNNPAYAEYEAVLCDEVDYFSEVFQKIAEDINKFQFDNKYDIDDISSYPIFMREIAAYINQFVLSDPTYAQNTFGGMFGDWNAVVEAVNKFNTDMKADFTESASFMPENDSSQNDSGSPDNDSGSELGFREPDGKSIYRKSTDEETAEGILTGKRIDNKMRHINDIAKKLDSGLKIVWCEKNSDKLHGKNGKYVRETNTIYLAKDIGIAQMYHEVFKHEFVHRLESKKAYQSFEKYLFEKSVAFENYARAQLEIIYQNEYFETRDDVFENLIENYYNRVKTDYTIPANIRKNFTWEDAKREIVADFVGKTLFKGKETRADMAQALSEFDGYERNNEALQNALDDYMTTVSRDDGSLDLFAEMAVDNRNLFQKIIDAIKDFINNLKHVPQNKSLVEDLEYIEQRLSRVYASKDTKKAADMAPKVQFSFGDANSSESRFIIEAINDNISAISNESIFSVKGERIPDELKKSEYVLNIFETQGKMAFNSKLGKVELVQSGAKSTVFHGFGAEKLAATKAIKDVIEKGNIIQTTENYNNTGVDRYVMAAKGNIDGKPAYVGLIIKTYPKQKNQNAKFYLHEAIIIETDSPIMTAPQLSVDTVSESVSNNKIPHEEDSVKNNISEDGEDYSDISDIKEEFSLGSPAQQARENRQKYDSGEITLEEYLKANDELWGQANETYGMLPQGENAQAPIATPKAVAEDKPTERFTRTIIETGKLNEEMLQGMEEKVLLGDFSYTVISDEAATKKAEAAVNNGTAEEIWTDVVNEGKRFNKNQLAIGEQLLADAIKNGDTKRVLELSAELADAFTRAGQIVQAARLLKKMTGAGRLVAAQRTVRTINKDLRQKYGEDRAPIKISDAAAKRLVNAKTESGIQHAYDAVLKEVAEQMPVTFLDQFNSWRYFAMLSNPKTHIRNVVGNLIFIPAFRIRYAMAVGMEQAVVKMGIIEADAATKSLIIKKEYTDFAKKDGKSREVVQLLKGNKYNDKTAIKEKQRIFKNDALEFLTTFNSNALEAEDMLFKNKHYIHALAGYLQAKGVDLNNVSEDILAEARIYAVNEARKATFNDESALADWIQKFGNKNIATNMAVEGVLPFKRTPINIVKRGIEYSPIGLAKTLTKGVYDIKKGKITPTEFIDGLASGLTGTGIMLAGMFLASLGCITGGEDDDELSAFEKLLGKQEYAVQILGKSYTIDWAAPACISFFIGVEIVNTVSEGEDFSLAQIGNAVWNSLEPITNLSMLSGIQSVIESTRYAEPSQILASIAGDAITSYAMQSIPSVLGAVSRTIDPTQRSWYIDKNNEVFDRFAQTLINSVKSKIPGLSYTQIPKIDAWGREVSRGNVGERVAENFVSPGYYSKVEYDEVSEELKRVFIETGANVFPQIAKNSFTANKEKKYLTADEYVTYAKAKGEYSFDYIYEFVNGNAYKNLTDGERAEVIDNLYKYANAKAKTTVSDYDIMKEFKTVTDREKNGGSAIDYYVYLAIQKK